MKKIILVVLCAITCIATFTACNQTSGNRTPKSEMMETDTSSTIQLPSSQVVDSAKEQKSGSFTPVEIQATKPIENNSDSWGESQTPCSSYAVTIFFIDSVQNEYVVDIKRYVTKKGVMDAELGKVGAEEIRKQEEEDLMKVKNFFKTLTTSTVTASDFYITYDDKIISIFKKDKITTETKGSVVIRESDPEPIWSGEFIKKPGRKPLLIHTGTEGVTNASPSNF